MSTFATQFTQDFFTSRRNFADGNTRVGEEGRLWYDSITNTIRISDGSTPGGIIVTSGGGGGSGTVTSVNTAGSGLGFSLSGGPITTSGTVTLNVPDSTTLRTSLNIGTVANINLNGNVNTVLSGDGSWISQTLITDAWKTFTVNGQSDLVASGNDTLQIVAGDGMWITTNPTASPNPTLTINATYSSNLDGGFPDSVYGGVPFIDAGGV